MWSLKESVIGYGFKINKKYGEALSEESGIAVDNGFQYMYNL